MMQHFPGEVAWAIRAKREQRKARVMKFKSLRLDGEFEQHRLNDDYGRFLHVAQPRSVPQATQASALASSEFHLLYVIDCNVKHCLGWQSRPLTRRRQRRPLQTQAIPK